MSTMECVRFFIPEKRLSRSSHIKQQALLAALDRGLGVSRCDFKVSERTKSGYESGWFLACRLDQFARFIVERDRANGENWVHELKPEIISYRDVRSGCADPICVLSDLTGVTTDDVLEVVNALGLSLDTLVRKFIKTRRVAIDVTGYDA